MSGRIAIDRSGYVATVMIDNMAKRNAMSQSMWIDLGDAIERLSGEADLRCVVLRGAGDAAFGSGADIEEFQAIRANKEQAIAFARHGHRAMYGVRDCPIPTVAAICGACVGGGLELAAFCDIRISREDGKFGVPIARLGATLAYPELEGLIRLAGPTTALELLLEGRIIGAQEALTKGIVNRVVATDRFDEEVRNTVSRIAAGAPLAARWHKKFVERLRKPAPLSDAELAEGYACYDTEDYKIGYETFLAKQSPTFLGR